MAKLRTIQILRGTTAQNNAYTGSAGELTMDTTLNEVRVHDGSTAGGHKIGTKIDNSTITENASQEIQAVATINANPATGATNPIYDWVGTLAEYQAQDIETNHPDWVCYITDDFSAQAYDAYSKGQTDVLLAGKVDKGHQIIEFQAPTAQNNYTWYRKYVDGWVEQGGRATTNSGNPYHVNLPVEMADIYYNITTLGQTSTDGYTNATWQVMPVNTATSPKSVTGFYAQSSITGYNLFFYWEVKGMAA